MYFNGGVDLERADSIQRNRSPMPTVAPLDLHRGKEEIRLPRHLPHVGQILDPRHPLASQRQ